MHLADISFLEWIYFFAFRHLSGMQKNITACGEYINNYSKFFSVSGKSE